MRVLLMAHDYRQIVNAIFWIATPSTWPRNDEAWQISSSLRAKRSNPDPLLKKGCFDKILKIYLIFGPDTQATPP